MGWAGGIGGWMVMTLWRLGRWWRQNVSLHLSTNRCLHLLCFFILYLDCFKIFVWPISPSGMFVFFSSTPFPFLSRPRPILLTTYLESRVARARSIKHCQLSHSSALEPSKCRSLIRRLPIRSIIHPPIYLTQIQYLLPSQPAFCERGWGR